MNDNLNALLYIIILFMNEKTSITNPLEKLNMLLTKYKDNELAINKINTYISNLEIHISSLLREKEQRDKRKKTLSLYKKNFIERFLIENNYYYIPDSSIFITYNNKNYTQINENNIWLNILTQINQNKKVLPWKHKIRIELISIIKKQLFTQCIPESHTIQLVLNIFSGIISPNKDHSKFLLTIIGDSILKKNTYNTYLVDSRVNTFVTSLQFQINKFIRCNFTNYLKYKYYNHDYNTTRLIYSKDNIDKEFLWEHIIKQYIYDIIAVACHYSNRFTNADNFIINECKNIDTQRYVLFLKENTKEDIVKQFSTKYFQKCDSLYITYEEAFYLWKIYLKSLKMPPIMFSKELLQHLENIFQISNERFIGITSPKLHYVKIFKHFMTDNIIIENTQSILYVGMIDKHTKNNDLINCNDKYDEDVNITINSFEISELLQLYSYWCEQNKINTSIDEDIILSLLKHFYNSIVIKENKYILGCKSNIWNKEKDISDFLKSDTSIMKFTTTYDNELIHISKLYQMYCDYITNNKKKFITSKSYFKSYLKIYGKNYLKR